MRLRDWEIFVLFVGATLGIVWGVLALDLWAATARIPAIFLAPLWLTLAVAIALGAFPLDPIALGALVSISLGLIPATLLVAYWRWRDG